MNNKDSEVTKSVWDDIKRVWGRIAGVVAAVAVSATFIIKMFHTPEDLTYTSIGFLGALLLAMSFYIDRQAKYTHEEILKYEHRARKDFEEIIKREKERSDEFRQDTERRIQHFVDSVDIVIANTEETRKDTLRIQLLMILEQQPENIDTILKLAETYFVDLHGDWYMTSEFNKWAKAHDIVVPPHIFQAIDSNHKNNK